MINSKTKVINPIAVELQYIYVLPSSIITLAPLLYLLMHPIFTFPANFVIDSHGMNWGLRIGSVLQISGNF